jgi:putative transposase
MRELLWRVSRYCGVEIITYAMLSNHFHLLVRVPEKVAADAAVTDEEILARAAQFRDEHSGHRQPSKMSK